MWLRRYFHGPTESEWHAMLPVETRILKQWHDDRLRGLVHEQWYTDLMWKRQTYSNEAFTQFMKRGGWEGWYRRKDYKKTEMQVIQDYREKYKAAIGSPNW